jgi:hypothetical protein
MALTIPKTFPTSGGNYEPVPADNHIGVLIGVTDLGTHQESYQGQPPKAVRKVRLQWELPQVLRTDGTTATISAVYNLSFHEKSSFRQMLDKWLGANWHAELKGGSLGALLDRPGMVNVEIKPDRNDPSGQRTFSIVTAVTKLPKGMAKPEVTRDTFYLDLDNKSLPAKLSFRDAEKIRASAEYQAGGFVDEAPQPNAQGGYPSGNSNSREAHGIPAPAVSYAPPKSDDSDIPF